MASPIAAQDQWNRMIRDIPRHQLPRGAAWNLVDYLPRRGAPARKRGGYSWYSNDVSATTASAAYIAAVAYAQFTGGAKVVCWDEDGRLYTIAANGTVTDVGASVLPISRPVMHRDKLFHGKFESLLRYYDGSSITTVASAPEAAHLCVFKDYLVAGRGEVGSTEYKNRVWFSEPGDPAGTWDTDNAWIDTSYDITGLAALRNMIIVFSNERAERIRGNSPPPSSDMQLEFLSGEGTVDARSIAVSGDLCVYANTSGIFMTDGAETTDLTKVGGMLTYWQELMASYTASYVLAGGILGGMYIICVSNEVTFVDALAVDLRTREFVRLSNFKFGMFAEAVGVTEELYAANLTNPRVVKVSPILSPTSSVKNDANGTAVAPIVETPFYAGEAGDRRTRFVYLSYDVRDAASDNPTLAVSYVDSPESTSYTSLGSFSETTRRTRDRLPVNLKSEGIAFKIAQANASSDTRLYQLELDLHTMEQSR